MGLVNDLASSFAIEQVTGAKRTLTLTGRALPYRPFELGGTQRNSVEWYPGNPVGVLQVYGAKEEPTTCNGYWKDVFLGETGHEPYAVVDGTPITTARELVDTMDAIRREGQEIRVTWLDRARRGVLERFTAKFHTGHDVEWEMQLTWTSQDEGFDDVPFSTGDLDSDLLDVPSQAQGLVGQLTDAAANFRTAFSDAYNSTVGKIDVAGAQIQALVDELQATIVTISAIDTVSSDVAARLSGILDGLKGEADDLSNVLHGEADGARLNLSGPILSLDGPATVGGVNNVAPPVGFGSTLADRATVRANADVCDQIRSLAASRQQKLRDARVGDILAVFTARSGDTLRTVSQHYYGTPDEWRGLMLYNQLATDALLAGQTVIVPRSPPRIPS